MTADEERSKKNQRGRKKKVSQENVATRVSNLSNPKKRTKKKHHVWWGREEGNEANKAASAVLTNGKEGRSRRAERRTDAYMLRSLDTEHAMGSNEESDAQYKGKDNATEGLRQKDKATKHTLGESCSLGNTYTKPRVKFLLKVSDRAGDKLNLKKEKI